MFSRIASLKRKVGGVKSRSEGEEPTAEPSSYSPYVPFRKEHEEFKAVYRPVSSDDAEMDHQQSHLQLPKSIENAKKLPGRLQSASASAGWQSEGSTSSYQEYHEQESRVPE